MRKRIGDVVRIRNMNGPVVDAYEGQIGVIVALAKRLYIPAAKVMVLGEICEFDIDELESM